MNAVVTTLTVLPYLRTYQLHCRDHFLSSCAKLDKRTGFYGMGVSLKRCVLYSCLTSFMYMFAKLLVLAQHSYSSSSHGRVLYQRCMNALYNDVLNVPQQFWYFFSHFFFFPSFYPSHLHEHNGAVDWRSVVHSSSCTVTNGTDRTASFQFLSNTQRVQV